MIDISNQIILNHIENYNEFYNLKILDYLSKTFIIHKERISIEKSSIIDLSSNNNIKIENNQYFILINDSSNNIVINIDNDNANYKLICKANSNIIIDKKITINFCNNIINTIDTNKIIYLIFKDFCKDNNIINNPKQLFENYSVINERKNNIFILNDEKIISKNECSYFIKLLDNYIENREYNIEKWGPGNNVNCLYLNVQDIANRDLFKKVDTKIFNIINKIINYLYSEYQIVSQGDSGYCLRKIYGATREHKDGILSQNDKTNKSVFKNQIRNMSVIIALNEDYESGEFYFPTQNFKVKLKTGDIIIFPPYWTHPHFVREPINNTYRYTINTWLYE